MTFLLGPAAPGKHRCATCSKSYSTNSHLRRHEATHSGRQELACPLCHAQFSRRDLARRHVENCATQGHEIILPTLKRGRKRTSCDSCSKRKLSCDTKKPCIRCRSGGVKCTYGQLGLTPSYATSDIEVEVRPTRRETGNAEAGASKKGTRISIDFLLKFTDPSGYRPSAAIAAEATDLDTIEDVDSQVPSFYPGRSLTLQNQPFSDADELCSEYFCFPLLMSRGEGKEAFPRVRGCPASDHEETSVLEARAREIVSRLLAQQSLMQQRDSGVQASFDALFANSVFTVANVRHFVWGFFHYFHDQFPILHQATFSMQTVSLPLLLTVILFGSMSYSPSDISLATRQVFDVAEAYVFDQLISTQMPQCTRETCSINNEIELLQAGLLFLIIQNNSNDMTTRRRIRLQRIPCLVAGVRASGLFAYKRKHLITGMNRPEWRLFLSDEARVRVAAWTFMTDSTLATFFNSLPQVAISEMIGDLPCEEDLFKAETTLEFERVALTESSGPQAATLSELVQCLLFPPAPRPLAQAGEPFKATIMLMTICALQSVIVASRMNFLSSATAEAILRALDRWKDLWDLANKDEEDGLLLQKGFEKHAVEYWWLARTVVKIGQLGDQSCRYMQPIPSDSAKDLNDFVRMYRDCA
ncbi:hypothetical protein BS50DRAFT_614831 [Corynespora cassiicola Philippines]|uniref:Zn(2)-C6 fungal-type domain-containing protein n=1 Tax=Corynespora cassiicola Philippines TaxID=1448308 RepID=A0A2T2P816_CORCC|nr:hypothetical protein BS50DRAFT_614831 [Corynespora cassiicola Philippines]